MFRKFASFLKFFLPLLNEKKFVAFDRRVKHVPT